MLEHVLGYIAQSSPPGTVILHGPLTPDHASIVDPVHGCVFYVETTGMLYAFDGRQREWFEMGTWHNMASYSWLGEPLRRRALRTPGQRRTIRAD